MTEVRGKNDGGVPPRAPIIDTDLHMCTATDKHVPTSKVAVPKDHGAQASGKNVATIGDPTTCPTGGPAAVATGATDYKLEDQPVARFNDLGDHTKAPATAALGIPGDSSLVATTGDFLIGGGTTVGNHHAATAACNKLEGGRQGKGLKGPDRQRYNNCGLECVRMCINAQRERENAKRALETPPRPPLPPLTEDELLYRGFVVGADGSVDYERKNPRTGKVELVPFKDDKSCDKKKKARDDAVQSIASSQAAQDLQTAKEKYMYVEDLATGGGATSAQLDRAAQAYAEARAKYYASDEYKNNVAAAEEAYYRCKDEQYKKFYGKGDDKNVYGTTGPDHREKALDSYGVASSRMDTDPQSLGPPVAQGKGVIVTMNNIPDKDDPNKGDPDKAKPLKVHEVVVTGFEYDEKGNLMQVRYNDPYNGCGMSMPAADYDAKRAKGSDANSKANVTKDKCW